ncbi:hypothetical protein DM826_07430 [Halonotius aquaticus]|uniref:Uncharacterized protein n=1 Tax=Halonotius aquaticus TaxID=2216978 RepID=A0A3A6PRF5_9EURY|nr:hypothetical protein [Halonotius aquaticus]RJX43130.1 hypothetical protein DM826_07430 [Halonotius aquaticus]
MSEHTLTRRDALRAGFTASVLLPTVATPVAAADDGLTASDTATFDIEHQPEQMQVAEDTAISIEWGSIPSNEELTVIFDVRPAGSSGSWETLDTYSFTPGGSNDSRTVTHDELFASGGDLTQHSEISTADLAITPGVDPPCKARTYDARVEVRASSLGSVGYLTDSFQVLNILDTGMGYNLGANFGLRYPDFSRKDHVDFDGEWSDFAIQIDSYSAGVEAMNELLPQEGDS